MIIIRPANERGTTKNDWLESKHTFSFGEYYDPRYSGFHTLRVINDDIVKGGAGFPPHDHNNMEILTYILEGQLEHKDSLGTGSIIKAGEVQLMHAGSGITHSEFNPSKKIPVHLLQIWILPDKKKYQPGYQQRDYSTEIKPGVWCAVANQDGEDNALVIHQDAKVLITKFEKESDTIEYVIPAGRYVWLHIAKGAVMLNGKKLQQGDGVAIKEEAPIKLSGASLGEVLLFDLG